MGLSENGKSPRARGAVLTALAVAIATTLLFSACAGAPTEKAAPSKPAGSGAAVGSASRPGGADLNAAPSPEPDRDKAPKVSKAAAAPTSGKSADVKADASGARASGVDAPEPELMTEEAAPRPASREAPASAASAPSQSGLKAGFSDDNDQFNYFVKFLDQYSSVPHYELAIGERIAVKVLDSEKRPVANAAVRVNVGQKLVASGRTYSDGSYFLYPLELGAADAHGYAVTAGAFGAQASTEVSRGGPRSVSLVLGAHRVVPSPLPVDVLFILDTTGSMGEEIERLRSTIEIISANITSLKPLPALRFGMVLYKDKDDEYDTKVVPFTSDLGQFQRALDEVSADGGGDDPEDLQSALRDAVGSMNWNSDGIRLGFIVTDAPPHLDYGQAFTYASSSRDARAKAIKIFSIGAGGLPLEGEYALRQIAQFTQGKYIFLTYGEKGESAGGAEGSVSHHTGSNFTTDKLEAIVIKFVREEIALQSDKPLVADESYSDARKIDAETREETLSKLFAQALQDLSDYSSLRLDPTSKLAVMPLAPAQGTAAESETDLPAEAEYFGSQLSLAASKAKLFTLVERGNLQAVLGELELQLSGLADEGNAAKAGKVLGADYLVTGTIFRGSDRYELFLKLLRVETAEVLAATKARVDLKLGL